MVFFDIRTRPAPILASPIITRERKSRTLLGNLVAVIAENMYPIMYWLDINIEALFSSSGISAICNDEVIDVIDVTNVTNLEDVNCVITNHI